jgi:hypothetical protein
VRKFYHLIGIFTKAPENRGKVVNNCLVIDVASHELEPVTVGLRAEVFVEASGGQTLFCGQENKSI